MQNLYILFQQNAIVSFECAVSGFVLQMRRDIVYLVTLAIKQSLSVNIRSPFSDEVIYTCLTSQMPQDDVLDNWPLSGFG